MPKKKNQLHKSVVLQIMFVFFFFLVLLDYGVNQHQPTCKPKRTGEQHLASRNSSKELGDPNLDRLSHILSGPFISRNTGFVFLVSQTEIQEPKESHTTSFPSSSSGFVLSATLQVERIIVYLNQVLLFWLPDWFSFFFFPVECCVFIAVC